MGGGYGQWGGGYGQWGGGYEQWGGGYGEGMDNGEDWEDNEFVFCLP